MLLLEIATWSCGLAILAALARMRLHLAKLPRLPGAGPASSSRGKVCLCMPARDEAAEIGPALDSWLAQDCPALSILVVDDGSTDGTPGLLSDRAAVQPDRLRVLRNDVLPPGWLGKNHALHLAVQQPEARAAEWLLFVDANVHASPDLLRRAFAFLEANPADLLALTFTLDAAGFAERLVALFLWPFFLIGIPPHQVPNPRHWAFCGGGAFTLVARRAYDAAGGHAAAPLEVVDDMMLARRVKRAGFVNRVAQGSPMLHLRMYHGLLDAVRSLRKSFASTGWWLLPICIPPVLVLFFAPLWLPFAGHPWLALALWLLVILAGGDADRRVSGRPFDLLWVAWPLLGGLFAWGMAWAFLDRLRGQNTWRGRTVKVR